MFLAINYYLIKKNIKFYPFNFKYFLKYLYRAFILNETNIAQTS